MSFSVEIGRHVSRRINAWGLSDSVLVEVYLRLQSLSDDAAGKLQRVRTPFDGMVFGFSLVDPENRLLEHAFVFHVEYSQDETSIRVITGAYLRAFGL